MEMKRYVGRAAEAGVLLTAVAAVLLVGCGGGGSGSSGSGNSGGTVSAFITALTDGVGLRSLALGASPVNAAVTMATALPSGAYATVSNEKVWDGAAWQAQSAVVTDYFLSSSGTWVDNTVSVPFTVNANGTLSSDGETETMVAVDLSGAPIKTGAAYRLVEPAIAGGSAVIAVGAMPAITSTTATYPSGSVGWISTGLVYSLDQYSVWLGSGTAKTPAGDLAALDFASASSYTVSNPLCGGGGKLVYSATQPVMANTARFDVYSNSSPNTCTAVTAGTSLLLGTVDLTYKTVRTQPVAEFSNPTGMTTWMFSVITGMTVQPTVLATINGKVWLGRKIPAGANMNVWMATGSYLQSAMLNKTAMDAVTAAAGLPSF